MSKFASKPEFRVAAKQHTCTYCSEHIKQADGYWYWKNFDGSWFTNRMHPECWNDYMQHGGELGFSYTPYHNDRGRDDEVNPPGD